VAQATASCPQQSQEDLTPACAPPFDGLGTEQDTLKALQCPRPEVLFCVYVCLCLCAVCVCVCVCLSDVTYRNLTQQLRL